MIGDNPYLTEQCRQDIARAYGSDRGAMGALVILGCVAMTVAACAGWLICYLL